MNAGIGSVAVEFHFLGIFFSRIFGIVSMQCKLFSIHHYVAAPYTIPQHFSYNELEHPA